VRNPAHWTIRLVVAVLAGSLLLTGALVGAAPQVWRLLNDHSQTPVVLPSFAGLANRTQILDVSNRQVGVFELQNSQPLTIDQVPDQVVAALLAVEDSGFYKHKGVNLRALVRATLANFQYSSGRQGASTITQQVVKNEYLAGLPRDGRYKILQARYAVMLEKTVPKSKIVERYLNTVYFGNNAYGVQAAAEVYFGAKVSDLTLAQAGFLAGLVRAPTSYDPISHPEQSRRRFSQVLDRFVSVGLMDKATADSTLQGFQLPETIQTIAQQSTSRTYFTEMVRDYLLNKSTVLGATYQERFAALYRGGLKIYTTLDQGAQAKAEKAAREKLPANKAGIQDSLVSLDTTSGALRAMVGGPGFSAGSNEINLALRRRQTGSSIKMFILTAALEAGVEGTDLIDGTLPCTLPNPDNPTQPFNITKGVSHPLSTLAEQTWLSINCAYARLAQIVGLHRLVNEVYKLASSDYLKPDLYKIYPYASFSTGANELSPMDMASGAQAIANGGVHFEPYFIEKIEGPSGVIYQHTPVSAQVISADVANKEVAILKQTLIKGTARRTPLATNRPAAGKTGTQDENTNAWFVGFTPQLTTAVWVGDPKAYTPMVNIPEFKKVGVPQVQGATFPAQIWKQYMDSALAGVAAADWPAAPAPTRNQVRLYLPGVDCIAQVVSGKLSPADMGPVKTVVPVTTAAPATPASATPTTIAAPVTTIPASVTTAYKGPVVSVVDPGTTIAPDNTDPFAPVVGVDPQKYYVYDCAKGIPKTVRTTIG